MSVSKQQFSVFKQHFMYFHTFFHQYIFSQKFLNKNFQFLNTCTKRTLSNCKTKFVLASPLTFVEFNHIYSYKPTSVTIFIAKCWLHFCGLQALLQYLLQNADCIFVSTPQVAEKTTYIHKKNLGTSKA